MRKDDLISIIKAWQSRHVRENESGGYNEDESLNPGEVINGRSDIGYYSDSPRMIQNSDPSEYPGILDSRNSMFSCSMGQQFQLQHSGGGPNSLLDVGNDHSSRYPIDQDPFMSSHSFQCVNGEEGEFRPTKRSRI